MTSKSTYTFQRASLDDLALLATWQSAPHVRKWWDSDEPYDSGYLADPRVARWIVSFADHAFAFMQDYTVHGWDDHHFAHLPQGSRGIDQFIGDPAMVGCGHGSAFIKQRMDQLFEGGAPVIATDPHPENKRAIAVYGKVGFKPLGPTRETRWGLILPMAAKR
ncbi:GNAT family N-acetyltransferase [uncultured Roseobacter sp.]|uniref:GNAT family N-acetyltransferase n=1 Tax=uncultured Roseobacter sp. TaxID=114847 RepID=UPI00262D5B1B|nr:GNAT family N-acetyltransferase [uncultured Roseobacter sp.]